MKWGIYQLRGTQNWGLPPSNLFRTTGWWGPWWPSSLHTICHVRGLLLGHSHKFPFFSYCIHHEAYLKFSYSSPSHMRGRRYFYQGEEMRGRQGDREGRRWVLCWRSGELTRNVTWSREKCLRQESKLVEIKSPMCQRAADIVYVQRGHAGCWRYPGKHSSARHGVAFRNL